MFAKLDTCHFAPNDSLSLSWRWLLHQLGCRSVFVYCKLTQGIAVDAEDAQLG